MKKPLFALISLMGVISVWIYLSQKPQENTISEIRAVLDNQVACWNQGNIDCFMEGYWNNDSLKFVGSSGVTYGYGNTLRNYKIRYPDQETMGKLTFDILNIDALSPQNYLVVGKFHLSRKKSIGDVSGFFSIVLKRIDNKWVIIADHTSAS